MKKITLISLAASLVMGCTVIVQKPLDVLTLFSSESKAQNQVWVGTFQLAFNEVKDNIVKNNIEFINEEPTKELIGLNNSEFNKEMLNENSYYTSYGKTSPSAKKQIEKDIKVKFDTKSDILDSSDWSEGIGKYYAYAMLKKQFEFFEKFDNLKKASFNNSIKKHEFFGIDEKSNEKLYKNLNVLFYNDKNDYAVSLRTVNGDRVYLYRTNKNQTMDELYKEMLAKTNNYEGNREFTKIDTFKAPKLKFKAERKYPELCNKQIKGTDLMFSEALETVEFELDETGGKVKSEAALMMKTCSLPFMEERPTPRYFNFDKTFVLFLVDQGKDNPYLSAKIKNLDVLK